MKLHMNESNAKAVGMYDPRFEHDNCGIGAVVNIKGVKTHQTVENALKIVENLKHRAGKDAEGKTGDGVGILLQISHKFFSKTMKSSGVFLGEERDYGIGMFFFPQDELKRNQARKMFEIIVKKEGMEFLGWREVPTVPSVLGTKALEKMPCIMQGFVKRPANVEKGLDFDRKLYVARRTFEQSNDDTYVYPFPAEPLYTRACSWYISCVPSSRICRMRITNRPSPSYIPVSVPIQTPAGRELIPTVLSYTTARSTPSRATRTRCWPGRKPWSPAI
mgnify:CR=1 FL=1